MVETADKVLKYKYITKNVAAKNGYDRHLHAKPLFGDNGSGMTRTRVCWRTGRNLFYDRTLRAPVGDARHLHRGLLKHAPAILPFAAPTTNSYRRVVPGYEAPSPRVLAAATARRASASDYLRQAQATAASSSARLTRPATRTPLVLPCLMAGLDA